MPNDVNILYSLKSGSPEIPSDEVLNNIVNKEADKFSSQTRIENFVHINDLFFDADITYIKDGVNRHRFAITLIDSYSKIPAGFFDFYTQDNFGSLNAIGQGSFFTKWGGKMADIVDSFENMDPERLYKSIRLNLSVNSGNSLHVDPKYRGKGVGSALLLTALKLAGACDAESFFIYDTSIPSLDFDRSKSFYSKFLTIPDGVFQFGFPLTEKVKEIYAKQGLVIKVPR